jgi:hypothetical protein
VTPIGARAIRALTLESLGDAVRRRVGIVVLALGLLSLFFVDTCTSCSPTVVRDGEAVELSELSGVTGIVLVVSLGLWIQVLAGVLASDHLAEPVSDGSAHLVLSRPVSRAAFALSRLAGVLLLSLGTGALLLGVCGALLAQRQGLDPGPLAAAAAACTAAAITVAASAMAVSLWLPRTATALGVLAVVWGIAWIEVLGGFGVELSPALAALRRFGPPLAGGMVSALAGWLGETPPVAGEPVAWAGRALVWCGLSLAALVGAFRRLELR